MSIPGWNGLLTCPFLICLDPEGDFVECIGRQDTPESATKVIMDHIRDWKREGKPLNTEPEH